MQLLLGDDPLAVSSQRSLSARALLGLYLQPITRTVEV